MVTGQLEYSHGPDPGRGLGTPDIDRTQVVLKI